MNGFEWWEGKALTLPKTGVGHIGHLSPPLVIGKLIIDSASDFVFPTRNPPARRSPPIPRTVFVLKTDRVSSTGELDLSAES